MIDFGWFWFGLDRLGGCVLASFLLLALLDGSFLVLVFGWFNWSVVLWVRVWFSIGLLLFCGMFGVGLGFGWCLCLLFVLSYCELLFAVCLLHLNLYCYRLLEALIAFWVLCLNVWCFFACVSCSFMCRWYFVADFTLCFACRLLLCDGFVGLSWFISSFSWVF